MLTALGVALLWFGAVTDILDISLCFAASLIIAFSRIELGKKASFLIYLATGVLSFFILPTKFISLIYLFFAGNYPLLKNLAEVRIKNGILLTVIKTVYFCAAIGATLLLSRYILLINDGLAIELVTFFLGVGACILFDFVLTRLISLYFIKLRKRLGVEKFLKWKKY